MAGKYMTPAKFEVIKAVINLVVKSQFEFVMTTIENSPWILISSQSPEVVSQCIAQRAVYSNIVRQVVFFRPLKGTPSSRRIVTVTGIEAKNAETLKGVIGANLWMTWKEDAGVQVADISLDQSLVDLSFVVKVPMGMQRINLEVPESLEIEGHGEWEMRKGVHCVLCHGTGHRQSQCQWKYVVNRLTYDIMDLKTALP